jgi:phage tail sheath gpL-like
MTQTNPIITANILSAETDVGANEHKILVLGQKLAGTATSGTLYTGLLSESEVNDLFGRKSHIAKKLRSIFKNLSISRLKPQVDAIALDDNGTTKASGTFTFTGTATENGIITVYVDSKITGKYEISVVSGDTADVVGGKLATLITDNLDANYSAANVSGVVTITAENAGTNGNQIRIDSAGAVAGISVAKSGNYLAGGATDPILTGVFDPVADLQYKTIDYPSVWDLDTLKDFTEARFNVDNKMIYGQGCTFKVDTYANLNTLGDSLNAKTLTIGVSKLDAGIFENPDVINSQFCAYRALLFTEGSNISSINSGNGETQGGVRWATIPYFNMPFINLPVIPQGDNFSGDEIIELESSGLWTFENNPTNITLLSRAVNTTYKTDVLGNPDRTFQTLNNMDALTISREYFFNNLKASFARHTLTDDLTLRGAPKAIVNRAIFLSKMLELYDSLVLDVILRNDKRSDFKDRISDTIQIDLANGKITTDALLPINSQLREILINFISVIE